MLSLRGLGAAATPNVTAIANAIAYAEGYYAPGSPGVVNSPSVAPVRNNNPCDLFSGGSLASYPTIDAGWAACDNQVSLIVNGGSAYYTPDESISQIAATYAPSSVSGNNPSAWASAVAGQLGLSPSDPLTAAGGSVATPPVDSTTASPALLPAISLTPDATDDSTDTSSGLDLNDLSFTDDSGNLTTFAWVSIAGVVILGIWAVSR